MGNLVRFDGHELSDRFILEAPQLGLLNPSPVLQKVPGRDGQVFRDTTLEPLELQVRLWAVNRSREQWRQDLLDLAKWLNVSEPKKLEVDYGDGLYWYGIPSAHVPVERYLEDWCADLSFTMPDPVRYGETRTQEITTSTTYFTVGGTYPSMPSVSGTMEGNANGNISLYHYSASTGTQIMTVPGVSSSSSVSVDAAKRTAKVASRTTMLELSSDWWRLAPGQNSARISTGSGSGTVTWTERWA